MKWKRVGRAVFALLVVVCILINCSPLRAEASVTGAALVTGAAATGVVGWLFAAAMGVVVADLTMDLIEGIGNSLESHLNDTATEDEKWILDDWLGNIKLGLDGDALAIPPDLLDNLLSWGKGLIQGESIEVEDLDSIAPEGFCYYNNLAATNIAIPSVVLPEIPNGYSFCDAYVYNKNGYYRLVLSTAPIFYDYSLDLDVRLKSESTILYKFVYYNDGGAWVSEYPPSEEYSSAVILLNDLVNQYFVWTSLERLPSEYLTEVVYPDLYIGDIPQQVLNGNFDDDEYELPYLHYDHIFADYSDPVEALNNVATQLQDESMTYEDYMDLVSGMALAPDLLLDLNTDVITYYLGASSSALEVRAVSVDGGTVSYQWYQQSPDYLLTPDIAGATSSVFYPPTDKVGTFKYYCKITNTNAKGYTNSITTSIAEVKVISDVIVDTPSDTVTGTGLKAWLQSMLEGITSGIQNLRDAVSNFFDSAVAGLLEGIKDIFIPSEDFLTAKVEALRAEFSFADTLISGGQMIGNSFQGFDTGPPIIYIDLGATRGDYDIGGKVAFIDLTWYEEYKPTVDTLLSSFLWVVFIWKLFQKAPGIISGMPGDFVMEGLQAVGVNMYSIGRKESYERLRQTNRRKLR